MKIVQTDILIIGAGLTGLTLAYLLRNSAFKVKIVEARGRIGGRINTLYSDKLTALEMGATWLGKKHTALVQLLETLNIGIYEQLMNDKAIYEADASNGAQLIPIPPNPDPSHRIEGGSTHLINTLAGYLKKEEIDLNQVVQSINKEGTTFLVKSTDQTYQANIVITTLPPFLLKHSIPINPPLPNDLLAVADQTHTWMGESIKVAIAYEKPFWRTINGTGTIFSNAGPINEMYDHSNEKLGRYGLKGFINGAYYTATKEQRAQVVIRQLQKYFGEAATNYLSYEETVWRKEAFTFTPYQGYIMPHQNNGHALYRKSYLNGTFFVAGSETAPQYPGYMDGAVRSAYHVYEAIKANRLTEII